MFIDIDNEIREINKPPVRLKVLNEFESTVKKQLDLKDSINHIFPIIKQNLSLIPVSRIFSSRSMLYFILRVQPKFDVCF